MLRQLLISGYDGLAVRRQMSVSAGRKSVVQVAANPNIMRSRQHLPYGLYWLDDVCRKSFRDRSVCPLMPLGVAYRTCQIAYGFSRPLIRTNSVRLNRGFHVALAIGGVVRVLIWVKSTSPLVGPTRPLDSAIRHLPFEYSSTTAT